VRAKESLVLTEMLLMILVFSMAASLCLKAFAWADITSRQNSDLSDAVLQVQNTAETVKVCRGDFGECTRLLGGGEADENRLTVYFDREWAVTGVKGAVFCLQVEKIESGEPLLGMAYVRCIYISGERLFSLKVCWQEVE
jgi:hypothetical protein